MDVLKDRMYCDPKASLSRRSAQTVMQRTLDCLVRMLAPILVHTAEEAWSAMTTRSQEVESVHLASMPDPDPAIDWQKDQPMHQRLMELRDQVLQVLEGLRQQKEIASNQQAAVTISATDQDAQVIEWFGLKDFAALNIVSEVMLERGHQQTSVRAAKSTNKKCQRCWNYWPSVGRSPHYPDLCQRCIEVVSSLH
jgi:isoleucyl-tRNA synthetase